MSLHTHLGGNFTLPGSNLTLKRMGYGSMPLSGPHAWGPPHDTDVALAVLREAVALGINHIDTSDYYGPHITNQLIRRALHPYPADLVIVTKVGFKRGTDGAFLLDSSPEGLTAAVHDNLRTLGRPLPCSCPKTSLPAWTASAAWLHETLQERQTCIMKR